MAHSASALGEMVLVSPAAGHIVTDGARVIEGLVMVLQGSCLLPQKSARERRQSLSEHPDGEHAPRAKSAAHMG